MLAVVLGARVRVVYDVTEPICGGTASLSPGLTSIDPDRAAIAIAAVLANSALPGGGAVERHRAFAPADIAATEWAARLLLGLGAGALVALLCAVVLGATRPTWRHRASAPPVGCPGVASPSRCSRRSR